MEFRQVESSLTLANGGISVIKVTLFKRGGAVNKKRKATTRQVAPYGISRVTDI